MNGHVVSSNPGASHTIVVIAAIVLDNIIFSGYACILLVFRTGISSGTLRSVIKYGLTLSFAFYIIVQMRRTVTLCCRQIARRFSVCKDIRLNSTHAYRLGMYVSYFPHQFLAWFWPQRCCLCTLFGRVWTVSQWAAWSCDLLPVIQPTRHLSPAIC